MYFSQKNYITKRFSADFRRKKWGNANVLKQIQQQ